MLEIILDSLLDTLKMIPFLFLAYLLIEFIEHSAKGNLARILNRFGVAGPLGGALLGCVPQCGFSAAASNLYGSNLITVGTLIAVFISTSDEAIPILLANPQQIKIIGILILSKVIIGAAAGLIIDFAARKTGHKQQKPDFNELCHDCHCEKRGILLPALKHTFEVGIFLLIVNFILTGIFTWIGHEQVMTFLSGMGGFQTVFAGLIGLIPNCASSVLLTELYLQGGLSFGALLAGLGSGAGAGAIVLFRANKKHLSKNLAIMGAVYIISVLSGILLNLFIQ